MKTCLSVVALGLTLITSWGQAWVHFSNGPLSFATPADRCVYLDAVGGQKLVGSEYVAGLWFAAGEDLAAVDARVSPERGNQTGPTRQFRPPTTSLPGTWIATEWYRLDGMNVGEIAAL